MNTEEDSLAKNERLAYIELIITLLKHYEYILCNAGIEGSKKDLLVNSYTRLIRSVGDLMNKLTHDERTYFYSSAHCGEYLMRCLPEKAPLDYTQDHIEH